MFNRKSSQHPEPKPKFFYGYTLVATGFFIMAIMWGTNYTFGIFFEPLRAEFGWTRAVTSGAFSLSLILTGVVAAISGKLTDKFGPKIVVTTAGILLSSGCLFLSQVHSIWQLYLFYGVLIGVGMGGSFIPLASTIVRWFDKRRGMMTGIVVSGLGIGTMIMSPVATWLISNYGWRTSYAVIGISAFILVIPAAQVLKYDPRPLGQSSYGGNELENKGSLPVTGYSLLEAMHTQQFWMLAIAWLCFGLGLGTVLVHIVPHAIDQGISAASAAIILSIVGGLSTAGRVMMGSASDRVGIKLSTIVCFVLVSIALFWLLAAKELWMLYLFAILFGFGYGGIAALASPLIAEQFGLSSHGVILGVIMICVESGSAIGPAVSGHLFDIRGNYNLAFLTVALIAVIGLIPISLLRATPPRKP
jgi:MFS family permease